MLVLCGLIIARSIGPWGRRPGQVESESNIRFKFVPGRCPGAGLPTQRGRRTQAVIDAAARTVGSNGILATTVAGYHRWPLGGILYNYYDSKEAMVRQWALRFRDDANQRALSVIRHADRERAYEAAAAHWYTWPRNRLRRSDQRVTVGDGQ